MARRKVSPAQQRAQLVRAKRLGLGSALKEIQLNFIVPEAREAFGEWRRLPITQLMIDVLREMAIDPPAAYLDTESIPVQYGVGSGIGLAAAVMDDPATLFPHLFTGVAPGAVALPETDYNSDPLSDTSPAEN
ncbi:MAG: hypothetical protein FJ279_00460 [Planctomycetes bacterium]|nr:hypothetical protein [Planctomycetota bacterium]